MTIDPFHWYIDRMAELFNPVDRMESFLLNSRKRHYAVNVAIEALASSLMKLVEAEQALLKLINQATQIVQGDHPDWEDVSFDDFDPDTIACRAAMQVLDIKLLVTLCIFIAILELGQP